MSIDWKRMIFDMQNSHIGMKRIDQARALGMRRHRLDTMVEGHMPRHDVGEKLIALWIEKTGKTRQELPKKIE